jgi:hypothetical protein
MRYKCFFLTTFIFAGLFLGTLFAQKHPYLGKQFLLGASMSGNPGWNDPEGEQFWLAAWNQRAAVSLTKRLFVGVQSRLFWSQANDQSVVQTWLGGGFVRYYLLVPRGEKRRWAFSTELGYYRGNHFLTDNVGTTGARKEPGQSVPDLGFSLELRAFKNIWIELAHHFLLEGPTDLNTHSSLGVVWHWGKANVYAPRKDL